MMICLFIDTEGKDHITHLHAILEVDGKVKDTLALGNEREKWPLGWDDLRKLRQLYEPFRLTERLFFLGFNAMHDYNLLQAVSPGILEDLDFSSRFWFPPIDIQQLAAVKLMRERKQVANFTLGNVCRAVEIEFDDTLAHNAEYDNRKAYELWKELHIGRLAI